MSAITRYRGDTKPVRAALTNSSTGQPMDITGCALRLAVSPNENPSSDDAVLKKNATIEGDPIDGVFVFNFDVADVDFIGEYTFDMELTDSAGKISTLTKDAWIMLQDIAK